MQRCIVTILLTIFLCSLTMAGSQSSARITLDGTWQFCQDVRREGIVQRWFDPSTDRTTWNTVDVPRFWEDYPSMQSYDGWGWFSRTFTVRDTAVPLSMYFAGVDDDATVWVNGVEAGSHTGYSDPFALDIGPLLHKGTNNIVVLVNDNGGGGGIYKPIVIVPTSKLESLLRSPFASRPARRSAPWVRDAVIYCVYLRSFSPEGTFKGLEQRLGEIKDLGATVLWLMPVHPTGEKNRKGSLGSPYSVKDFYGVNPEFGTMDDFRSLVQAAHAQGLKLIIDLVINHTAWDNALVTEHPEWYTKDEKGNIIAPNPDWSDVADLDYTKKELRTYMSDMMCWWVRDAGIDGFRCDVAELVPTDFWNRVRKRLDAIKPVMMLSEGTLPEHHLNAFDLTYSWNMYDILQPLLEGKRLPSAIDRILHNEELHFPKQSLRLRFNTNHDKNAWDAPAVKKFGLDGLMLSTVLVHTIPGVPLIYNGEEVANDAVLGLFEKVSIDWTRPPVQRELLRTLARVRKEHPALRGGNCSRVATGQDSVVYAFVRAAKGDRVLTVLNCSRAAVEVEIDATALAGPGKVKTVMDVVSSSLTEVGEHAKLKIRLEPLGYRIYTIAK